MKPKLIRTPLLDGVDFNGRRIQVFETGNFTAPLALLIDNETVKPGTDKEIADYLEGGAK